MRILIGADTYYPHVNGAAQAAQRIAFYLKQNKHDVLVIAPSPTLRSEFYFHQGVRIFGLRSIPLLFYKGFRLVPPIFIRKEIRKVVRDFDPDIVHIQSHFYVCRNVLAVAKDLHISAVGTNHFMPENLLHYFHLPKSPERLLEKWGWHQFRKVFNKLDAVTTPTRAAADLLKTNGFERPVIVISNGIDLKKFNPQKSGDYVKERFHIPPKPILLYTGRVDKEKHLDTILKALPEVLKKTDIHFVVAGGGAEKQAIENLAKKLKIERAITFTGYLPNEELPDVYRIAHCFIIAGTAELQSLVTMEAMASGLPIVAANALALPELVKNVQNGYLFEPGDSWGIAQAVIRIFRDNVLQSKMAQTSLKIIKTHDINQTIKQFENLYTTLI